MIESGWTEFGGETTPPFKAFCFSDVFDGFRFYIRPRFEKGNQAFLVVFFRSRLFV